MRKAAIEDASIEMLSVFERVSAEARKEKKAVPTINKMIYYWTRKPLVVGRAVALACTLENPKDAEVLLGLSKRQTGIQDGPRPEQIQEYAGQGSFEDHGAGTPFAGTGKLNVPVCRAGA